MPGLEYRNSMRAVLHKIFLMTVLMMPGLICAELKDPTRPGGFQFSAGDEVETSKLAEQTVLQAIFYHPEKAAALINGRHYVVGDVVGDSKVVSIYAEKVVLGGDAGETTLKLVPTVVKRHGEKTSPAGKE